MEELIYVDRRNSNCNKWDGQTAMFGEEGLHAMWVADMDFKIPALDFSNFFGSFLEDFNTPDFMPLLNEVKQLKCDSCGSTFEDIIDTGRYGCPNCYDVFEDRMDPILKKLQGANRHVGRLGKISNNNLKFQDKESKKEKKEEKTNPVDKLQEDLKKAIKEERYEDAAKIRDEIKKLSK